MSAINLDQRLSSRTLERHPFPIPTGWFFVDYSENLKPGEVRNVELFDQEWVLYRNESGVPGMTDPYCPHLGAHIGHGGTVCGDHLRCPFHHWEYDEQGYCKKIPYAKVMPPIVKKGPILLTLPTLDKYGMIWAWYHPNCVAPTWELPYIPEMEDASGWVGSRRGTWSANTFLQEIAENGVDVAHLKFLHGAPIIPPVDAAYEGHRMKLDIGHGYILGDIHGPGLQVMHFHQNGITATMISYTQPVTAGRSQMNMSFRHPDYSDDAAKFKEAERVVDHMIGAAAGESSAGFEAVDFMVWNHKKYRPKPLLCDGDGPILKFRKWFSQFYVEPQTAAQA
ncbi:MAG: Rieske (2Fe-2S) protein [Nevskiaceae bacterium]|nr:MAG: Rieske (2Fe-2S) protein [Nevskiaceae bacterium]TBR73714.1 MAG: Rieske (2Fe-2S) protein [Nevskiaceae bacterium]